MRTSRQLLYKIAKYFFNMGLKRSTTLSNKILEEHIDEWIAANMDNDNVEN